VAKHSSWDTELYEAQHSFVWKMGEAMLAALGAQSGERILDLGCGTGQLTSAIAASGAEVLGLDASPEMIGQARQNFPGLQFTLQNAGGMQFDAEFDAIFSNAALHWMLDAEAVAAAMSKALLEGGRLVAEFGGKGNIRTIECAIEAVLARYLGVALPRTGTYFPTISEYASLLECHGLEVRSAVLFDRPTPLAGERGMEQWIRQFAFYYFESLSARQQAQALHEVVEELRPALWKGDGWIADYRRLRIFAVKL